MKKLIAEFIVNGGLTYAIFELSKVEEFSLNYWLMILCLIGLLVFNRSLGYLKGIKK